VKQVPEEETSSVNAYFELALFKEAQSFMKLVAESG